LKADQMVLENARVRHEKLRNNEANNAIDDHETHIEAKIKKGDSFRHKHPASGDAISNVWQFRDVYRFFNISPP